MATSGAARRARRGHTTSHVAGETLSAYVDGELAADERREVERHLRGCATCRTTLRAYQRIGAGVKDLATQAPPESLKQDLFRRLPDE